MTNAFVSDEEIREYYEEKRRKGEEMKGLVPVKATVAKEVGWVFSTRFTNAELTVIEEAAKRKGMKTGAFIREAALKAAVEGTAVGAEGKVNLTPSEQETLFQALRQVIAPKAEPARRRRTRRSNTAAQEAPPR